MTTANRWLGLAFLAGVPALTMGLLLFSLVWSEPFPTLLMPSFNRANAAEAETFTRTSFFLGESSDAVEVTALEFSQLDFTQSQSGPIIAELLDQITDSEDEVIPWVFERLAGIVPSECGNEVELREELVQLDRETQSLVPVEVVTSRQLGTLQC